MPEAAQPSQRGVVLYRGDTIISEEACANSGQRVLVKRSARRQPSSQEIAALQNEYEFTRRLSGTGVRQALGMEDREGSPALILQPVDGKTIHDYLSISRPDLAERLRLAAELASAVLGIHKQGVVHNDLAGDNVLIRDSDRSLVVIDFGSALRRGHFVPGTGTQTGMRKAKRESLPYLPPEWILERQLSADYRTDTYSLGVLLYEILTGELPFQADDPHELFHKQVAQQPAPPSWKNPEVPILLDRIVLKLLAKDPEDRYQSVHGLLTDLRECIRQRELGRTVRSFPLGRADHPGEPRMPARLYGREREIKRLHEAVLLASQETSRLILVSGYAGIGKTALVGEIRQPVLKHGGLFVQGKAEQYRSGVPYAAIAAAFGDLVSAILGKPEVELAEWSKAFSAALGDSGGALRGVVPGLERVIGKQKEVAFVGGQEARNRLSYLVRRLVAGVIGLVRPLVIFLDDLQWVDSASLDVLAALLGDGGVNGLGVIGAYRDNEVNDGHPLAKRLQELEQAGTFVERVSLENLKETELASLLADALRPSSDITTLSSLVFEKTEGNPLFARQLLHYLHQTNQIRFDHESQRWQWDLDSLQALDISANVVDHLASTVKGLGKNAQEVLKLAACAGSTVDPVVVAGVLGKSLDEVTRELGASGVARLLHRDNGSYRFVHDRIQQAICGLMDDGQRSRYHLAIGRRLLRDGTDAQVDEALFRIVDHLNAGASRLRSRRQRVELAEINLRAARKSRSAAAFAAMRSYLCQGLKLLPTDSWQSHYKLSLELHTLAAEAEYLNTNFERARERAQLVVGKARSILDQIAAHETLMHCHNACAHMKESLETGSRALRLLGVSLVGEPPQSLNVEQFRNLPTMTDPASLAAMRILTLMFPPAMIAAPQLLPVVIFTLVARCLSNGNCAHSAFAYALYGLYLCREPEGISLGYAFGQLALEMLETRGNGELDNRVREIVEGFIEPWQHRHLRDVMDSMRRIAASSLESGELEIAANQYMSLCILLWMVGEPLEAAREQLAEYVRSIRELRLTFQMRVATVWAQLQLNLSGLAEDPRRLAGEYFDQERVLPLLDHEHNLTKYYIYLPLAVHCYLIGDYEKACLYSEMAGEQWPHLFGFPIVVTQAAFHALSMLQLYPGAGADKQRDYLRMLTPIRRRLAGLCRQGAANFAQHYYLVEAERARVLGQLDRALRYYERAIQAAQRNRYPNLEALGCELAGRFCTGQNLQEAAQHYLVKAYRLYHRWGAALKLEDLESRYPDLLGNEGSRLLDAPIPETSDLSSARRRMQSALKAQRALSTETDLETLLNTMMGVVMEHAGAEKGVLLLKQDGRWVIQATGNFQESEYAVLVNLPYSLDGANESNALLPSSVVNLCLRTEQPLSISHALTDTRFGSDPYIRRHRVKSILCLPILYQGRMNGALYLENRLTSEVFGRIRMEMLELLCTQFSISFENALLYQALGERLRFEKLMAGLSATLVNLPAGKVDRQLALWLKKLVAFLEVDVGALYQYSAENAGLVLTHCYATPGTRKPPCVLAERSWYAERITAGQTVVIRELAELPPEAEEERNRLSKQGVVSWVEIPLRVGGTSLGAIEFASRRRGSRWSPQVVELLSRIEETLAQALKRKNNEATLEGRTAELRETAEKLKSLSVHLQDVREHERTRIAREIHDELGQALTVLRMDTARIARHLAEDPALLREQLNGMIELIDSATESVQRICCELRPQLLDVLGLFEALEWLGEEFQKREGITCRVTCSGPEIQDERYVTVLFRIVQEALTNISRHAQAREASVRLNVGELRVLLEIDDDGKGISSAQIVDERSLGLLGMRERVSFLDGALEIAGSPGQGTHLSVSLPRETMP